MLKIQKLDCRPVFNKQPFHFIIIDANPPLNDQYVSQICEILNNILDLCISIKGSNRIAAFGLSFIGSHTRCVVPLQLFKSNYQTIRKDLGNFRDGFTEVYFGEETTKSSFTQALDDVYAQYKTLCSEKQISLDNDVLDQLCITLLTCQPAKEMVQMIESVIRQLRVSYAARIEVISLKKCYCIASLFTGSSNSSSKTCINSPLQNGSNADNEDCKELADLENEGFEELTDIVFSCLDLDVFQLEGFFKSWLHDAGTDQEHVRLLLPLNKLEGNFTDSKQSEDTIEIKCDMKDCLINPQILPNGGMFLLSNDFGFQQFVTPSNAKTNKNKVPLYVFECVKTLNIAGICESVLFGMPMTISPTQCWKMEWELHERNQELFVALNRVLLDKNWALLVRKGVHGFNSSERITRNYFLILPTDKPACMLIKSVANRELLLPNFVEDILNCDAQNLPSSVIETVSNSLSNLEMDERFNPLAISSGLYSQLSNNVGVKTKPVKRAQQTVPIETIKCKPSTSNTGLPKTAKVIPQSNWNAETRRNIVHFEWDDKSTQFQSAAKLLAANISYKQ